MEIELLILIAGIIGTVAFSISGALIAIENEMDVFGVIILSVITACCGGLLRDTIIGEKINIFENPWYCLIAVITGVVVFIIMYFLKNLKWENSKVYKTTFNIIDSIGLGAFVVTGAGNALNSSMNSAFAVIFFAVLTAVGGGIIRDIIVNKIPAIFRKHVYAVAAIIGAVVFYSLMYFNIDYTINVIVTIGLVIIIRYLAFRFEWSLPKVHLKH